MSDDDMQTLLQEIQWVRKLLMLQTLAAGCKQKHLAAALGVSDATISRHDAEGICKANGGWTVCRRLERIE